MTRKVSDLSLRYLVGRMFLHTFQWCAVIAVLWLGTQCYMWQLEMLMVDCVLGMFVWMPR